MTVFQSSFSRFSFFVALICFFLILPKLSLAATRTWDGGGTDGTCGGGAGDGNKWSCAANWSSDTAPIAGDVATFDGTSTKDATIDTAFSILTLNMNAGYTGTITQAADLTIASTGNFTHNTTDGKFQWTAGTLMFVGGTGTWDVDTGDDTFGNVTINKTTATLVTITSGDTAVVTGTLTLADGNIDTGIIEARGDVVHGAGFDGGTGRLNITQGSSDINLTAGGQLPRISLTATRNINGPGSGTVTFDGMLGISGGAFVGGAGSVTVSAGGLTLASPGALTAPSATLDITGDWTHTDSSTFNHNSGTVIFRGNANADFNVTESFNNVNLNSSSVGRSVESGDTMIVLGLLTLTNGTLNSGTIDVRGNVTQTATFDGGNNGVITFGDNAVAQTYTVNGGEGPIIVFNSPSDASDSIVFAAAGTFRSILVTAGFSGAIPIVNSGDFPVTIQIWDQSAGSYDASAQSSWTVIDFDRIGGTFIAPTLVTTNSSPTQNWAITGDQVFNNLTLSKTGGAAINLSLAGSSITTTGTLTLTNGALTASSTGKMVAEGGVTVGAGFDGGGMPLWFSGGATQSFNLTGATGLYNGDIVVNKSGGQVNLTSDLVLDAASQDLTIQEGIFSLAGNNLTVNGTSGVTSVQDGGTLLVRGSETFTLNAGSPSLATGSTVQFTGDGDAAADTFTVTGLASTYDTLTIASTDGATDTFQLGGPLVVNGDFNLTSGTFDVTTSNYAMLMHGDWSNSGVFVPRAGTVTFNGPDHELFGTTTFYNFAENTGSASTLTFPAGATQTFTNDLTLTGSAAGALALRSSVPGSQAKIDPQGTRTLQYLNVQDNDNDNALVATCSAGCTNSGNNENWFFVSAAGSSTVSSSNLSVSAPACSPSQTVQVSLTGTDVADYLLSEDPNFISGTWLAFTPQTGQTMTADFNLSAGDGKKMVYARFRSPTGIQSGTYLAEIVLDVTGACQGSTAPAAPAETPVTPISVLESLNSCPDKAEFLDDQGLLKPGAALLKFATGSEVYVIESNPANPATRILRWLKDEEIANQNFGPRWSKYVLELPELGVGYVVGEPITTKEHSGTVEDLHSRAALTDAVSYELSIVTPDGVRRNGSSNYARRATNANGIGTYSFEDKTDFDYNDVVLQIDPSACLTQRITALPIEASLRSQVWLTVYWEGIPEADILVFADSQDAVSNIATVNVANDILMNGLVKIELKNGLNSQLFRPLSLIGNFLHRLLTFR